MTFTPRNRSAIRDAFLTNLSARYTAIGQTLLTMRGSDDYMRADTLAVVLEGLEAQAYQQTQEILPDQAQSTLERHGYVEGVERIAAVKAVLTVRVTGTPSASITVTSQTLQTAEGLTYEITTASPFSLNGSGYADILARCLTAGTDGNQASSTVLTWTSTPTNLNPTATVQSTTTAGVAEESNEAFARRIIARRQERPASGNRSDWRDWATSVTGVSDAYVYPLMNPSGTTGVYGCVTVVALGPAQGNNTTNTRILAGAAITRIMGYLEGTNDVDGGTTGDLKQLRPVTIKQGDYTIEAASTSSQAVTIEIVVSNANAFPFAYSAGYLVLASPTPTTTTFSLNGDVTSAFSAGKYILVYVGTSNARGGYVMRKITSATFAAGKTAIVLDTACPAAPPDTEIVYPAPANWESIRDAVFDYFDALGPGDAASPSQRWPSEDSQARATLYKSALGAAALVSGVVSATVTTPSSDVTPAAKTIVVLTRLIVKAP